MRAILGRDYAIDETVFTTGGKLALFNTIQWRCWWITATK